MELVSLLPPSSLLPLDKVVVVVVAEEVGRAIRDSKSRGAPRMSLLLSSGTSKREEKKSPCIWKGHDQNLGSTDLY